MYRYAIGAAVGVAVGYFLLPKALGISGAGADASAERPSGQAPAARMAQDVRYMCRQLDPMLADLESALEDRNLSLTEGARLYSRVQTLF